MKKKIYTALLVVYTTLCYSQENKAENEIFFLDFFVGGSTLSDGSIKSGYSINYQNKNDLFTIRTSSSKKIKDNAFLNFWFLPFVYLDTPVNWQEQSFLYGKRYLKNGFCFYRDIKSEI